MTVKDLIKKLEQFHPDMPVVIDGYEGGLHDVDMVIETDIILNYNDSWYLGAHELAAGFFEDEKETCITAKAVYLPR
jgi:hypothetical protein